MNYLPPTSPAFQRRGMVLVLVLVVVSLLTIAALTFSEMMFTEKRAAGLTVAQAQARASADSGLELVRFFLTQDEESLEQAGGWYNNQQRFRGVTVVDDSDPKRRAKFAIVCPSVDLEDSTGLRFGIEDESTKLNLNAMMAIEKSSKGSGRSVLLGLPGMTDEIADAILDWLDEDDEPREYGAEVDYYGSLTPGYAPKNGPLETVEELLLVKGVTPALLFGCDTNRNGLADGGEPAGESLDGVDNSDGSMSRGWAAYLTLYSLEKNTRPDGQPKVNLNQDDMQTLHEELTSALSNAQWADFIVAYRQNGPYTGTKIGEMPSGKELDLTQKGTVKFTTVLDLIGSRVQVKYPGDKDPTVLESPFPNLPGVMNAYLPALMENLTVNTSKTIPGRININQASPTALGGIPGMTSEALEQIVSQRQPDPIQRDPNHKYETWILAEGIVSLDEMKALMPFVTGGGNVYRAQVVGYFDGGGPAARIEAVLDASKSPPKVVFWRDLSHLGRGYPVEILGVTAGF